MLPATRVGRLVVALLVAWSAVALVMFHSARPTGPLSFGLRRGWAEPYVPQGWAFFTRNPRFAETIALRRQPDGRWVRVIAFPYGAAGNLLGWRRKGRSQAYDLKTIIGRVPPNAWRTCTRSRARCLDRRKPIDVVLTRRGAVLCGRLGLAAVHPVPWGQARRSGIRPTVEYAVVHVRCPRA